MVMVTAQGKDWLKICLIEQDLVKSPFSFVKVAIFSWSRDKSVLKIVGERFGKPLWEETYQTK